MSNNNSKFDTEIDAGVFFGTLFKIAFAIGAVVFAIWYYFNIYKPEEKAYINGTRYAYQIIHDEMMDMYEKQGRVFDENKKNDDEFCKILANKYASNKQGNCNNINPISAVENFKIKKSKITIYGLEKPASFIEGAWAKDIIIDVNGEDEGENQAGVDRTILRLYSHGRIGGVLAPVNCSSSDDKDYGFKKSFYCIGSQEMDFLTFNKPLGFDIEQIGADNGKTRVISHDVPFVKADCLAFGGSIVNSEDYCDEKMFYSLRGCDDEDYSCNIRLTK